MQSNPLVQQVPPFDVSRLVSSFNIDNGLTELAATVTESSFALVLEEALSYPSVLELILSNLPTDVPLTQWLLAQFPSDPNLFADSLTARIMERLSLFFLMQSSREFQGDEFSSDSAKFVKCAPNVLCAFSSLTYPDDAPVLETSQEFLVSRASQKQIKQLKRLTAKNAPHEKVLIQAGQQIPRSEEEKEDMLGSVHAKLKDIFEQYLSKIRTPAISDSVKKSFIRTEIVDLVPSVDTHLTTVTKEDPQEDANPKAQHIVAEESSAAGLLTPLHNLELLNYFDSPDGFGQWRIFLSSRADRELRSYRRTNPKTYEIVMRKILDLSNGHFSFDNQKKLTGPSREVPIYEAKMTGDLRLVYYVDCTTSLTDSQCEIQALRIFGCYTHAQMDHRLWDSVSRHLHSRGKEFRQRCLKRERRRGDTGDVYIPASFPAREEDEENPETVSSIPNTAVEDHNELHSLITLEKYVALSKEVLESIESGLDSAFPFELSKYEQKIVQYPASCYVLGRSGTGKTTTMLYKMLWVEKAYQLHTGGSQHPRQIFVTRSAVLARKVEEHFLTYTTKLRGVTSRPRQVQDIEASSNDLINHNNSSAWKDSNLAFSNLEDSDFPLFIPLDDLYYLLEADINWDQPGFGLDSSFRPISELKGRFLTFQRFLGEYWPNFSRRLTDTLNPALVLNEIIGSILGSERTLISEHGYLSKAQYLESSRTAFSNFSQEQRASIYDVFLAYKELKRQNDDYDISDRSRTITAALRHGALDIKKIDQLYVDETQDNLLIDALVLRSICRNPEGLFWAGDTAQTISAGSSFRFADLKAFMYRYEEKRLSHLSKQKAAEQLSKISPNVFQLATNFRSHAGIVDCAHAVVELIKKFFPHTIDMLKRERGVVEGAKPMFCNGFDVDQFKEGGNFSSTVISSERIELGAHQCILVRDEESRQRFIDEVGDIGLVVTLYDSKGLEFNDVVLLNFFKDSTLTKEQWSVVLNEVPGVYAPKFDLVKHSAICLELKSLYVAITRARNNLRIIDSSDKSEPMKILWEKSGYITEVSFHEAFSNFAVQSSAEDWNQRAKEFFEREKYALARDSYLRGQNRRHAAVANAFYERERAQRTPNKVGRNKANERAENFSKAAEAFVQCADDAEGTLARMKYRHMAGECFEEAQLLMKAVEQYRHAEDFTRAAILLRKLGSFDEVKELLLKHQSAIECSVFENIRDIVRLYYVSSRQYSKAHGLFDSLEDELEYLEDRNLDLAQVDLFVGLGRITEAADVHLAYGRFEDAVLLLIEGPSKDKSHFLKASKAVLEGLMTYITFGSNPRSGDTVHNLISLSRKIPMDIWGTEEYRFQEMMMYRSLYSNDLPKLYTMVKTFLACKNLSAALLVLDYIFTVTPLETDLDQVSKAAPLLAHFNHYIELLRDAAFFGDPSEERNQRFFGVVQEDVDAFSFRPRSLFATSQSMNDGVLRSSNVGDSETARVYSKSEIISVFRQHLQERLRQRVTEENKLCRSAPAFNPCVKHIALNDCRGTRCQEPHIKVDVKEWYPDWIRIHLLQIMITGSIIRLETQTEAQNMQFFWLRKFFEAVNPPHHAMGSIAHLKPAFYEEMRSPLIALRNRIREITSAWDVHPPFKFLTMAMVTADLAFGFDRKEASVYMFRARFVQPGAFPKVFLRGPEARNSLLELLIAHKGSDPNSLILGMLFIDHVMKYPLKVDIGVFCAFIEKICGQYAALYRYHRHGSFHNIMLPHSWMRRLVNDFDPSDTKNKIRQTPFIILSALESMIRVLHFDRADSNLMMFQGDTLTDIPYPLRAIYVSRICRVLGLLAYNIQVDAFRRDIVQIFKKLGTNRSLTSIPSAYRLYFTVQNSNYLAYLVRQSFGHSPFDKMVELRDESSPHGQYNRFVRRIKYRTYEDIVAAFAKSGSSDSLDDSNEQDAVITTIGPEHQDIIAGDANEVLEDEQYLQDNEEGKGDDVSADQDVNMGDPVDVKLPDEFLVQHSPEEHAKASVIQKTFRRFQELRVLKASPNLCGRTYTMFLECQATLKGEKMQKARETRSYRLRFLGAIPGLLACIHTISDQLHAEKNNVKKQLNPRNNKIKHELLDGLSERLTSLNAGVKTMTKFQRNLGLNSGLHQRASVDDLRSAVQLVQDALRNRKFPIVISEDVKESLELIYRIVFEKASAPTAKLPKKPSLNVEDVGDYP